MASEYIQDLAFLQISKAIMATANSVGNSANDGNSGESSIFDVMRRKWGKKVQDVFQDIVAPLKRRSTYEELPEHIWPSELIEMSNIAPKGMGHHFTPCHLSNPTWCDYCGDFIWGVYKQCLRCQTCQYTCHQHCVPAVTLNCKSVSDDGVEVKTPSPIEPRPHLETSLSLGNIRPGCARSVTTAHPADTSIVQLHPDCAQPTAPHPAQVVQSDPATHTSTHNLSRSASEGFVTSRHSFPYKPGSLTLPKSLGHLPSIPVGSCQQASLRSNIHGPSYPPSTNLAYPPSTGLREDATVQVTQETCTITGDNSNNNKVEELQESLSDISVCPNADGEPANEKDETDSGYRSGTIPDDKLPRIPSQETLDRQELKRKVAKYNHFVPAASLEVTDKESFQGFVKVTMNLIRPITMELGARPPSIYELLTREHIIEENTQQVAFYMPRDTHKSLHITSDTTTKEVVTTLLKKFHILDHPRKFAMYEQEFSDRNKLVRLRRLTDKDFPLRAILTWDPERIKNYRMVLQENETGEIVWDAFSLPELGNFLKVLDREEKETILELKHKYAYMKQYMERRLGELRNERNRISQTNK